jgi:CHAT domain-containing protein
MKKRSVNHPLNGHLDHRQATPISQPSFTPRLGQFGKQFGKQLRDRFHRLRYRLLILFLSALFCTLSPPLLATLPPSPSFPPPPAPLLPASSSLLAQTPTPTDPRTLYEQGEYEKARQIWEQRGKAATDPLEQIRHRINEAQALKALGAYRRAQDLLQELSDRPELKSIDEKSDSKTPFLKEKVQVLRSLGDVYQAIGNLDKARTVLNDSLNIAKTFNFTDEISATNFSLGLVERSGIVRNISRELVISSRAELATKKQSALAFLAQVEEGNRKLEQSAIEPATRLQSNLNQIRLLLDLLPQLNRFLVAGFSLSSREIVGSSATYFLTTILQDSSLSPQLQTLVPLVRNLGKEDVAPWVRDLGELRRYNVQLTDQLMQLLLEVSRQLPNSPTNRITVDAHINFAQSLSRLKPVLTTGNEVDRQLGENLNQILGKLRPATTSSANSQTNKLSDSLQNTWKKLRSSGQIVLFWPRQTQSELQLWVNRSFQVAPEVLTQAIRKAQAINNKRAEASAQITLAEFYSSTADLGSSNEVTKAQYWRAVETLSRETLQLVQGEDLPDLIFRAQRQFSRSLFKTGKLKQARAACRVSASTLETNRQNLVAVDQDVQYTFRDSVEPFYRECITALLPTDSEQRPLPTDDLKDDAVKSQQADIDAARKLVESLQLAELDNFFREACINGRKVAIDQLIDERKRDDTNVAVLYPILLAEQKNPDNSVSRQVGVIAKLPNIKPLLYRVSNPFSGDIEKFLVELRQQLANGKTADAKRNSKQVYDWLVQPFRTELEQQKVDTLVFVSDAAFRNVPMAALYDGKDYLVDHFAIALSPGLQLLAPTTSKQKPLKALAAGLIDIPKKYDNLATFPPENLQTVLKAMETAQILSPPPLKEDDFASDKLAKRLGSDSYDVIQLFTHAKFSSRKEDNYILMADGRIGIDEFSAILRQRDRAQQEPIDLLVFSTCDSAGNDNRAALGLAGLALKAGARSTLASIWTAPVGPTTEFTQMFYQEFVAARKAKQPKAKALQLAQQAIKAKYGEPSVWATYVLVGDWV